MQALLSVLTSTFQAGFTGPYMIAKCQNKLQVCHITLLKPYMTPVFSLSVDIVSTTATAGQSASELSVEMVDNLEIETSDFL